MTGEAGHHLPAAEVRLVDRVDHDHHPASHLFPCVLVCILGPIATALLQMAVGAVETGRRRKDAHCPYELIDGNAFEDLDILEDLFGQLWLLDASALSSDNDGARRPCNRRRRSKCPDGFPTHGHDVFAGRGPGSMHLLRKRPDRQG
jgi:hypothetical protein